MELLLKYFLFEAILALTASEVLQQSQLPMHGHPQLMIAVRSLIITHNAVVSRKDKLRKNPFAPNRRANHLPTELCITCRTH